MGLGYGSVHKGIRYLHGAAQEYDGKWVEKGTGFHGAFHRKARAARAEAETLTQLIREDRAQLIGAIRQELLTGISNLSVFERLARQLEAFPDLPLERADYVRAASYANTCRARGVQGSNTDFLICAAAVRHELALYTSDKDFTRFAIHLPIRLFSPPSA